MSTGRLEAFSDGVFAIAITLLILEVQVPPGPAPLSDRLVAAWPVEVSFVISFLLIGIMWINHHSMLVLIRAADHLLVVANLILLLTVTVIPFTTSVVSDQMAHGNAADQRTAAVLYSLGFVAFTVAFNALWWCAASGRRLLKPDLADRVITGQTRRALIGIPTFGVATLIALVNPQLSFGVVGGLALLYLLPPGLPATLARRQHTDGA